MTLAGSLLLAMTAAVQPADVEALLEALRQSQDVPGVAAALVVEDRVLFAGGAGVSDIDSQARITADTAFYLGSVSKVLTAVLVLGLAEDDVMPLEAPLEFRSENRPVITPSMLLSHSSGLPREGPFNYWFNAEFPDWVELADFARETPLAFEPATRTSYSNIGYAVLGQLAARRLGLGFDAAIRQRLLEPLEMASSGYGGPAPNVATGYTPPGRLLPSNERPFAGVGAAAGDRFVREYHEARAMAPAFGAYSSADDMSRFLRYLLGDARDPLPTREQRRKLYIAEAEWALGMQPDERGGRRIARHGGWFAAHRSHVLLDPAAGIGIVVMSNGDNARPAQIAEALYDLVLSGIAISDSP